ncbi:MAG: AAA family ATPase [Chitinivibrionia bacterium]|nr:AAA family ATPase [Chitinivibrionia bacterium]
MEAACHRALEDLDQVRSEIARVFFGHEEVLEQVLTALLAGGHILLEGVPGVGKTHLLKSLSQTLALSFSRIQFTPDLMPADLLGTPILMRDAQGDRVFQFQKGPLFSQVVLADEINRATPKTQSALLEVMEERQITVSGQRYPMEAPFFVLATQNPIEMEGTYPLPEAQLDRFFFNVFVPFPKEEALSRIADLGPGRESPPVRPLLDGKRLLELQRLVREVLVSETVKRYAVSLVLATHPDRHPRGEGGRVIRYGASPRGVLSLILGGKARALMNGRFHVGKQDIREVALPALRHRILLNFEGEMEGVRPDRLLEEIFREVDS